MLTAAAEYVRDIFLDVNVGGVSVSYARKNETSIPITAVRGRTPFRTTDIEGRSILIVSDRDYLVAPTAINFGAGQVVPQRGDRITDGAEVYEVWPIVQGEPHWRPCDQEAKLIRVHCRRIS